jgi:N-acyl-D-aspartate/D-glutamate deacylase
VLDLLDSERQRISTIYFSMREENVRLQLQQPWIKISTDAPGLDPAAGQENPVHPRAYGTYPRVLGRYVRDEGVLPLEDAVRKMTSAVATVWACATGVCCARACAPTSSSSIPRPYGTTRRSPTRTGFPPASSRSG